MNITYHEENGYLLPNVTVPVGPKIGIWGKRRADYLRKNKRPIYIGIAAFREAKRSLGGSGSASQ